MKPARILIPAATGIPGFLLGLAIAPLQRKPGDEIVSTSTSAGFHKTTDPATGPDDVKPNHRTRANERVADKKPNEPRVSIPLGTVVQLLK